jgi:hypothetical protein
VTTDRGREALNRKLDSITLEEVMFRGQTLNEVIRELNKLVKARDPQKKGMQFNLLNDVSLAKIGPASPLRDITVRQILDAIVATSDIPLSYNVESFAVVIWRSSVPRSSLHTRWFRIDPTTFGEGLRGLLGISAVSSRTNRSAQALMADLRQVVTAVGVDLAAPKSIHFSQQLGQLMVRATLADLDEIEQLVQNLNASPAQLTVEVRLCEFTEEAARELSQDPVLGKGVLGSVSGAIRASTTNESEQTFQAILTSEQYHATLRALEGRPGVDVLTVPKVTTLSGRQAQIKSVNVRYIVTDVSTGGGAQNETTTFQPLAEPFELGPVIDLVPYVGADGLTISMTVVTTIKEFVGYENLEGLLASVKVGQQAPVTQVVPLPNFRLRQLVASAKVLDGQTVVLAGGASNVERRGFTGNATAGAGQNERANSGRKSLLVFVTPTLIDPAGNRVH